MSDSEGEDPREEIDETTKEDDDGKKRRKRKRKRKKATDDDNEDKPADGEKDNTAKELEIDRTVFVEGIPYDCKQSDVCEFFQQNLKVDADSITDCRLPTWPDTGRLKGYGHVVFATRELQQLACALNAKKLYLKKRYLNIAPAKAPSSSAAVTTTPSLQGAPSKTIVLHNLSYDATENDILDVLESSHVVQGGVRVVRHNATKRSRGFAYVEFDSVEAAQEATTKPILVLDRPCRVDFDHGSVQKSFRTDTGRLWHKSYGEKRHKNDDA
jgi:nucleolin